MSYSENDVLAKVGDLLVEINEEYAAVQEQEGQLTVIQFGMLAAKAKYLAAHFDLLSQLDAQQSTALAYPSQSSAEITFTPATPKVEEKEDQQDTKAEIPVDEPEVQEQEQEEKQQPEPKQPVAEESTEEEIEELESSDEEPQIEEEQEEKAIEVEEPALAQPEQESPKAPSTEQQSESAQSISAWRNLTEDKAAQETIKEEETAVINSVVEESRTIEINQPQHTEEAPTASSRPLTLNEMIQQQRRAGLTNANQFKTPATKTEQIVDLKTAVSLNDKLLFIKDLFNGYSLAYTEAIELLNRFDNMAEADAFLQANYSLKNNWASKPQTVEKLYNILQKKFA